MDRYHKLNKGETCLCIDSVSPVNDIMMSCTISKDYLTEDEEKVLSQIRALWKESRKIKSRLKELDSAINRVRTDKSSYDDRGVHDLNGADKEMISRERRQCMQRLEALRKQRKILEKAREEANRLKMILLGHAP